MEASEAKELLNITIVGIIIIAFFVIIMSLISTKSENDKLRALIIAASEQQMDKKTIEIISRKILKEK